MTKAEMTYNDVFCFIVKDGIQKIHIDPINKRYVAAQLTLLKNIYNNIYIYMYIYIFIYTYIHTHIFNHTFHFFCIDCLG